MSKDEYYNLEWILLNDYGYYILSNSQVNKKLCGIKPRIDSLYDVDGYDDNHKMIFYYHQLNRKFHLLNIIL